MSRLRFTLIALCTAGLVWGCGGGDPDKRIVTVYSPHGKPILPDFEKLFEAVHPDVDVRWLDMGSQDVLDRVRSERANPQGMSGGARRRPTSSRPPTMAC